MKKNKAEEIWARYNYRMIPKEDCEKVLRELDDFYKSQGDEASRRSLDPFLRPEVAQRGFPKPMTPYYVTFLLKDSFLKRDGLGVKK